MQIMDGKEVAASLRKEIAAEVVALVAAGKGRKRRYLVAVLVGNDGASQTYVGTQGEMLRRRWASARPCLRLPEETTRRSSSARRDRPAERAIRTWTGSSCSFRLPGAHLGAGGDRGDRPAQGRGRVSIRSIRGGWFRACPPICPPRRTGFWRCSGTTRSRRPGKHCVVIGRSNIVGRPDRQPAVAEGLGLHGHVLPQPDEEPRERSVAAGDIVIAALGKAEFVTADMIKPGAVVDRRGHHARAERPDQERGGDRWATSSSTRWLPSAATSRRCRAAVGPHATIISLMKNTLKAGRGEVYGR